MAASLLFRVVLAAAALAAWPGPALPADSTPAHPDGKAVLDCRSCHATDTPTKANPALVQCPRAMLVRGSQAPAQSVGDLVLGVGDKPYGAVRFSHRTHARMAEMGQGCIVCHHYNFNPSRPVMRCSECHPAAPAKAELGIPDLPRARHRLCIDCHRRMDKNWSCASCHPSGGQKAAQKAPTPQLPKRVIFETRSDAGRVVTFLHEDHARRFGLKCMDCHKDTTCAGCHGPGQVGKRAVVTHRLSGPVSQAPHASCVSCHQSDGCDKCHAEKPRERFDHARVAGWPENRFHARLDCRRCHAGRGFAKGGGDCESCHKGWKQSFDHRKTTLALDETHAALECESCHRDPLFVAPPDCASCHPDKSYPKEKPGKRWPGGVKGR